MTINDELNFYVRVAKAAYKEMTADEIEYLEAELTLYKQHMLAIDSTCDEFMGEAILFTHDYAFFLLPFLFHEMALLEDAKLSFLDCARLRELIARIEYCYMLEEERDFSECRIIKATGGRACATA